MQTNERETEIIMEHVFKNKENLEVALDIISRTQKIRERIIKTFLEELKGFICKKLDMSQWVWETGLCDKPYRGNKYLNFGVASKFGVLQKPVGISLSDNPTGNNPYIRVFTSSIDTELMSRLISKLNEVFESGESDGEQWLWCQPLTFFNWNYADCTNKGTLIKMYTNPDCAVEAIGNDLLKIIEVVKTVIEEWGKQNPC